MCDSTLDQVSLPLAPCQPLGRRPSPGTAVLGVVSSLRPPAEETPAATQKSSRLQSLDSRDRTKLVIFVRQMCDIQDMARWVGFMGSFRAWFA